MEKNKNVLIASISGIVACLVCVGIIFLFSPKENNDLKGNENLSNQEVDMSNDDEEILLGDTEVACSTTVKVCASGIEIDGLCHSQYEPLSYNDCRLAGGTYSNTTGYCYYDSGKQKVEAGCATCNSNAYLNNRKCYTCSSPKVIVGANCRGDSSTCCKEAAQPVTITCTNPTYNGASRKIAECNYGGISNAWQTAAGTYTVTCAGESKQCELKKATPTITDFSNMTMAVGENKSLLARSSIGGSITYELLSGNAVLLNGAVVTGQNPGTSTIRANLASTSNYNSATATITVTVTAPSTPSPTSTPTCTTPYTYYNGTECIRCNSGYSANTTITECHIAVPAGSYLVQVGSPGMLSCPANTYSDGGICYQDGDGCDDVLRSSCKPCGEGKTSPIGSSKDQCKDDPNASNCSISVSTSAQKVSPYITTAKGKCGVGSGDTWTVDVSISGNGCNGRILTMSGTNAVRTGSGSGYNVSNGQSFHFLYKATSCCTSATATGTLSSKSTDGSSSGVTLKLSDSASVTTSNNWHFDGTRCVTVSDYNSHKHSQTEADNASVDEYWILKNYDTSVCPNASNVTDNVNRTVDIYTRGCGDTYTPPGPPITPNPSSSPNPTPSPTPTPPPKIKKCYIDSDNKYHWTSSPEASWKIATDSEGNEITNPDLCPPKPGCYVDPKGEYHWGEFSTKEGYIFHAEITDDKLCKKDESYACYKKGDDYIWSNVKPEGYTLVELPYEQCENPACYYKESSKKRVWGYYSKVNGYFKLVDENDNPIPFEQCKNDMCYKDPDGDYVWGDYEGDDDFTPLPDITDISECGPDVPTPPTGLTPSKVVYIFMAILMAFGIGFIYYSTIMKKEH